jgi:hypothetical protein
MSPLTETELREALRITAQALPVSTDAYAENQRRIARRRKQRWVGGAVATVAAAVAVIAVVTQLWPRPADTLRLTPSRPSPSAPQWVGPAYERLVGTPQVIGSFTDPPVGPRQVVDYFAYSTDPRSLHRADLLLCAGTVVPGTYRIESPSPFFVQCGGPALPDPGHAIGVEGQFASQPSDSPDTTPPIAGQDDVYVVSRDVASGEFYLADGSTVPGELLGDDDPSMPAYFLAAAPGVVVEGIIVRDAAGHVLEDQKFCALPMQGDTCRPAQ